MLNDNCNSEKLNGIHGSHKKENESERKTEVKLNVEDSKLYEKKISIFSQKKESENNRDIFTNNNSVNLFNVKNSNPFIGGENIFKIAKNQTPSVGNEEIEELRK